MFKRLLAVSVLLVLSLIAVAPLSAQDDRLTVVATTTIIADIAQNVGGDLVEVSALVPLDTDIHAFMPDPRDIATLSDADLLLVNGLGLEGFIDAVVNNADVPLVYLYEGVNLRPFGAIGHDHADDHADDHGDDHMGGMSSPSVTGGYLTITASADDTLIGVTTDAAHTVEIHQTTVTDDVASMDEVGEIALPAGEPVELAPGGYHLMLIDVERDLLPDTTIDLTLTFASGATVTVTAAVQDIPATADAVTVDGISVANAWVRPALASEGHDHDEADDDDHADDHMDEVACEIAGEHGEDDHEHAETECDAHIWGDPNNAMIMAQNIAQAFADADPANADVYMANAAAYVDTLAALDAELADLFATIPEDQRVLVTNHDFLGYLADRYDFEVIGVIIPGGATLAEPSPQDVAGLIEVVRDEGVPAIFAEISNTSALAQVIADEVGADVEIVYLYSGALSADGGATTYVEYMRANAQAIVTALTGDRP